MFWFQGRRFQLAMVGVMLSSTPQRKSKGLSACHAHMIWHGQAKGYNVLIGTTPPKARDPLFREVSNNSQPQTVAVVSVQICLRVSLIPEMFFVGHVHDVDPHEFSYCAYRCLCMCKDILG